MSTTPDTELEAAVRRGRAVGDRRRQLAVATAESDQEAHDAVLELLGQGVSIAEIARLTDYHRNSVRAIRDQPRREQTVG